MKKMKRFGTVWLAVIWVLIALIGLGGATFAWFTFQPETNVTPMSSTVSSGDTALYISTSADEESFSTACELPQFVGGSLEPVTTNDLIRFYQATMQDRNGISYRFREVTDSLDTKVLHGVLYLQSLKDNCDVYFYRPSMGVGTDMQTLAALRLGMRIVTAEGIQTYIFRLDQLGDTSGAQSVTTVSTPGSIVAGISADGSPVFVPDIAVDPGAYFADTNKTEPGPGLSPLCTIQAKEIAQVEYWLYLEGCDENCINSVQNIETVLQLSFAGVSR